MKDAETATKLGRNPSPLWSSALERFRDELEGPEDLEAIENIQSLQDLVDSFASLQSAAPRKQPGVISLNRLAPKLKFVDDFSAVLALCFGADATLTATVWGSIRLILSHASAAAETFQDVLDMLEDLSLTLPRFHRYESTLPMTRSFQTALVDVYTEVICFYARAIHFLRENPNAILRKVDWQSFKNDFSRTIMRIRRMSPAVEIEADMARMAKDELNYKEVLDLMNAIKVGKGAGGEDKVRFNNIPHPINSKFSGRDDVLKKVDAAIVDPDGSSASLKSLALFGLGGVGKTQIAIQFAYRNLDKFDVVLWVAADNAISIGQSLKTVAEGLNLFGADDDTKDAAAAVWKVKSWLSSTRSSWLLIFDNADDAATLRTAWPGTTHGSILITTRDFGVATNSAAQYIQVGVLDDEAGSQMLRRAIGGPALPSPEEIQDTRAISQALGGLPLALTQIGGFIAQRRMRLKDFLPLYERNRPRIDARKPAGTDYEHTLSTVWDMSFAKLSQDSTSLLKIMALLEPDGISEDIFLQGAEGLDDFSFLTDDMDLSDATEELLRVALIDRVAEEALLSMHRLVQTAAIRRIEDADRARYFDAVVHMLSWGFPDHASEDIGHQIATWSRCEKCLPHIYNLTTAAKQHSLKPENQEKYANLLLRCAWYLYEREMYVIARGMVDQAISTFSDTTTLEYASAIDLGGLLDLDLAQAVRALPPFQQALEIRKARLGPEDPFIAYSLNNIALAYTEMGELQLAYEAHEEATRLRLEANSDRIENSYSNMSCLLLRMGKPDDAEEMMARCRSLKGLTDEAFLATGNPRYSGNMVVLSRIRLKQGRTKDALRLATKALSFRRKLLGNRLKTCDSMYDVACTLLQEGHSSTAMELLEELVLISETFVEGEGQRARAFFKLSQIHEERGRKEESKDCREKATVLRDKVNPDLKGAPFEEAEFSKLCPWMLW